MSDDVSDLEVLNTLLIDNTDPSNTRYGMLTPDEVDVLMGIVQRLTREAVG